MAKRQKKRTTEVRTTDVTTADVAQGLLSDEELTHLAYLADLARFKDFTPDQDRLGWRPKSVGKLGYKEPE